MDVLFIIIVLAIIILVWFIITNFITLVLFGWNSLSKLLVETPEKQQPVQKYYLQYIFIQHEYRTRGFVTLRIYSQGIQFKAPLLPQTMVKLLFIPWEHIQKVHNRKILWFNVLQVETASIQLYILGKSALHIEKYYKAIAH